MKQPLVTIMIPCYNQAGSIARALESALKQSYQNFEIVVSDDSSKDNTEKIVEPYLKDHRVRYYKSKSQWGRVKNYRHLVFELSRGELLINLDGDDYFVSTSFIESAVNAFENSEAHSVKLAMVFGRQQFQDSSNQKIWCNPPPMPEGIYSARETILSLPNWREVMPHIATLYRKDFAIQADVFNDDIVYADAQALIQISCLGPTQFINEIVGTWVRNGNNESSNADFEKRCRNFAMIDTPAAFFAQQKVLSMIEIDLWKRRMAIKLGRESACALLDQGDLTSYEKFLVFLQKKYGATVAKKIQTDWRIRLRRKIPGFFRWSEAIKSISFARKKI